jgi:serine O-acetyltransferase
MSIRDEIKAIQSRDPAARSSIEVVLAYPGFHAVRFHRLAHRLYQRKLFLPARLVSHLSRFLTGIEIHPGATIGERVFIDHGMGVVIGETAIVGDDCTLYQGVTLGGTGKARGKRHPTLEPKVTVGVGAKILGDVVIGEGARIGGGAVVLRDVPAHSTAVGIPAKTVGWTDPHSGEMRRVETMPDPQRDALMAITQRIEELEDETRKLRLALQEVNDERSIGCGNG